MCPDAPDADHRGGRPGREEDARHDARRGRRQAGVLHAARRPQARRRREAQQRPLGDEHVVGKAAVDRQAGELVMHAVHVVATTACDAEPAAVRRIDEHGVALRNRRDAGADLLHQPAFSWPRTRGSVTPAGSIRPSIACRSVAQTPAPPMRTSTSLGCETSGTGRSSNSSGRWYSEALRPSCAKPPPSSPRWDAPSQSGSPPAPPPARNSWLTSGASLAALRSTRSTAPANSPCRSTRRRSRRAPSR